MKKSLISALLLAATVVASQAAGIPWAKAYSHAKAVSKTSGKLMMIDFYTDWCVFCKKLDSDTYPAAEVVKESGQFVPIRLDAEKNPDGARLAKKFNIQGYPTVLFLDANENVAYKIVGFEAPKDFAAAMSKAATARHDKARFEVALKLNPNDFSSLLGLASVELGIGDNDKAANLADKAGSVLPADKRGDLLSAYNAIGDGFESNDEAKKAIPYFTKAIDPDFPKQTAYARMNVSACYFAQEKPKEAIPFLEDLLKMGREADDFRDTAAQMLEAAKKAK